MNYFNDWIANHTRASEKDRHDYVDNKYYYELISENPIIYIESAIKPEAVNVCPYCNKKGTPRFITFWEPVIQHIKYAYVCGSQPCVYMHILANI